MTNRSYKVRFYDTEIYRGKRKASYTVRWSVNGRRHGQSYATSALAESFRATLRVAVNNGEPFDMDTGLPVSHATSAAEVTNYEIALQLRRQGIPPAQVAEWAGNSVPVLLATYARCVTGQPAELQQRIEGPQRLPAGPPPACRCPSLGLSPHRVGGPDPEPGDARTSASGTAVQSAMSTP